MTEPWLLALKHACFYNGMSTYSKTWLQIVFPVYIWVLIGLMILVSHFSQRFANLLGNNPVSVLATLILLPYTKVLHTLIATAYFTHLECPTYDRSVWFYSGVSHAHICVGMLLRCGHPRPRSPFCCTNQIAQVKYINCVMSHHKWLTCKFFCHKSKRCWLLIV